jgi:hypothetical protein
MDPVAAFVQNSIMTVLENEFLKVAVSSRGAELTSIFHNTF